MSTPLDEPTDDRQDDPEEPEDPRLSALIEALARGETIDWQQAESAADSAEAKERIRALSAISEVATFHRTWLAEGGIKGDLDEDEEPDDEVPSHWGELEILERVGRGSFGDVYKAREPRLDRIVALKLIRASARTPEREAETLREGRLLAKVRHPNVATVHGTAGADGRVGFWMEFLEGKNLQEILQEKGRFEPREAAEIGISLCRALAAVHAQGIVHRDVKAQNVVRENDGRIVLTDFGVGRDAQDIQGEAPSLSGTPLYLAPELFEGKPPSPASDLYALGVLLFYLVTGEFPITGKSFDELRDAHQGRKRRWLKELRKDLPGTFVAAVERALDRDPEKRAGVGELKGELGRFLGERPLRRKRIRQVATTSAAFAMVTLSALGWVGKDSISARIHYWRAIELHDKQKFKDAIRDLKEAKRLDPGFAGSYLKLMSYQTGIGQYEEAFQVGIEARKSCGRFSHRDCLEVTARVDLQNLKYEGALESFQSLYKVDRDPLILQEIVQARRNLLQVNLTEEEIEVLSKVDKSVAAGELVLMLSASGEDEKARAALASWLLRFPGDQYQPWIAGLVAMTSSNPKEALRQFDALSKDGDAEDESAGLIFKAKTLLFEGRLKEARKVLNQRASLNRTEGIDRNEALRTILLAECFRRDNQPGQASEQLRLILDLPKFPTNLKLFRNAGLIASAMSDRELVQKFSGIVHSLSDQPPTDLAKSFDAQLQGELELLAWRENHDPKHLERAGRLFDQAWRLRSDPQNAFSLARFYAEQGDCEQAQENLERVKEMRGLIFDDFYIPWTVYNDALDLENRCSMR